MLTWFCERQDFRRAHEQYAYHSFYLLGIIYIAAEALLTIFCAYIDLSLSKSLHWNKAKKHVNEMVLVT